MIRFKISASRFADACTVTEYIGVAVGNMGQQMKALPKFLVDKDDKYIVEVVLDDDGDIAELKNLDEAMKIMDGITTKRFEKLRKELTEAARNIVNPPSGGDSKEA